MKTIFDNNLKAIAPDLIKKRHGQVLETCEYLINKYLISQLKQLVHWDRIDEMEEFELDLLSKELHIDYYNPGSSIEEKRKLCKESISIHMKKGTVGAVKDILKIYFKNAELKRWYEAGLEPGYFLVNIHDDNIDYSKITDIKEMINSTKKFTQHLDNLVFIKEDSTNINYYTGDHNASRIIDKYNPI